MHRSIKRSALIVGAVAAVTALSAGPAMAAVTPMATTGAVSAVTADGATFAGTVSTNGLAAPVPWQFNYCQKANPFVCGFTVGGTIAAGTTTAVSVTDSTTDLLPSTSYTVKLVVTNPNLAGFTYLNTTVFGLPVPFATTGPGSASLTGKTLKVKGGRVAVAMKCGKQLDCSGGMLSITTRHAGKKIACGSAKFTILAGTHKTVNTSKISAKCKALLVLSPKGIKAKLTATFTFQKGISANVTLKLAKK